VLAAIFLICPFGIGDANYINLRFATFGSLLLFAGTNMRGDRRALSVGIGAALALLLIVRIGALDLAWDRSQQDVRDLRMLGAMLPPGSKVLAVEARPDEDRAAYFRDQPPWRELRGVYSTFIYAPALWVIERKVFFPLIFAIPGQQPLKVAAPYRDLAAPFGVPPDYRALADPAIMRDELKSAPYLADWQKTFDYVVVLSSGRARHLDLLQHAPLTLLGKTDIASLWKVQR